MNGRFTDEELAIAKSVDLCAVAESLGYTVFTTIDTDYDVPLNTRVQTINKYCAKYG